MTIRQLEVFLAIARAQSFSRAAERIHLSQPTLSEHTRQLEQELGAPLFVRHSRSVTLTEAGRGVEGHPTPPVGAPAARQPARPQPRGPAPGAPARGARPTPGG